MVAAGHAADQFENLAFQFGVADFGQRLQDRHIDAVQVEICRSRRGLGLQGGLGVGTLEEVGDIDSEDLGELKQPAGADPVCSLLVLLDLLESQSDRFGQRRLRHSPGKASDANALAHVTVYGM